MPNDTLIGTDVEAYTVTAAGFDTASNGIGAGSTTFDLLGRWNDIEVNVDIDWKTTTSSSGKLVERRAGPLDWDASAKNNIRFNGSIALNLILNNDFIIIYFTESSSGRRIFLAGGIKKSSYSAGADAFKESLDIINTGPLADGSFSIGYVG